MTPRVWVLRDALGFELRRSEYLMHCIGPVYRKDRDAHATLVNSAQRNNYADSHRAGGYTLTREDVV